MHHNHNQWGKVMQGGLEQLRRYAAAASAPAKRSKFSPKLYTSACSFIHSGHFTRFSVHIKLYTLPPFQRAIQKMVCTHFHSNENLATDKAGRFKLSREKVKWQKEEILTKISRRGETQWRRGKSAFSAASRRDRRGGTEFRCLKACAGLCLRRDIYCTVNSIQCIVYETILYSE